MIYIRTFAYNAEKTLVKTIESVLVQTIGEFKYYLLDNGSTDSTGDIVREYAQKDARIVPFYNKVNGAFEENPDFWEITHMLLKEDYYVALDADDYYEPTFLEEMLEFMRIENLDMAACGTEFFEAETGRGLGGRLIPHSIVLNNSMGYDSLFPNVHWNLRQIWGKIYSAKVANAMYESNKPDWWPKAYGGDTANVLTCLKKADRIGVYGKVLHHYSVSQKSVSYQWKEGREKCDVILHEKTCEFLINKVGYISDINQKFLYAVYLHAVLDTLQLLTKSELPNAKRLDICTSIFGNNLTKDALKTDLSCIANDTEIKAQVSEYKIVFLKWSIKIFDKIAKEDFSKLIEFFRLSNNYIDIILSEEQIYELLKTDSQVLYEFLLENYVEALDLLENIISDLELVQEYHLLLAQNIAALLSNEDKYVKYSKKLIALFMKNGNVELAKAELEEWLQILPNDSDFMEMRNRI